MKIIQGERFQHERDLYGSDGLHFISCAFDGEEDGESALKESKNLILEDCFLNLRYPLWHDDNVRLLRAELTENCRAALWYTHNVSIEQSKLHGIKAVRECHNVQIRDTQIVSPEFGWKSGALLLERCAIESEYAFLLSADLTLRGTQFSGKYSFQYTQNVVLEDCRLDTKDAFWHAKNVTLKNCVVKGEYLGWYSENVTFLDCTIIGTQPLCYCKGLKLINCKTERCDLAFEYSEVDAHIVGSLDSVKNPRAGKIVADKIGELIYTEDSVYPCQCEVIFG